MKICFGGTKVFPTACVRNAKPRRNSNIAHDHHASGPQATTTIALRAILRTMTTQQMSVLVQPLTSVTRSTATVRVGLP